VTCASREEREPDWTRLSEGCDQEPETDPTGEVTNAVGECAVHLPGEVRPLLVLLWLRELPIRSNTLGRTTLKSPLLELCTEFCRLNLRISSPKSDPLLLISSAVCSSLATFLLYAPCNDCKSGMGCLSRAVVGVEPLEERGPIFGAAMLARCNGSRQCLTLVGSWTHTQDACTGERMRG
jgi:hypothetical protein